MFQLGLAAGKRLELTQFVADVCECQPEVRNETVKVLLRASLIHVAENGILGAANVCDLLV